MSVKPIIREVAPGVTIFSVPFKLAILPMGGRSTAIRLTNGDVWLMASHALDASTKDALAKLGNVKYLVSADLDHYFFLAEYKKAYPDALIIGPDGLQAKLDKQGKGAKLDGTYYKDAEGTKYGFEDEITPILFPAHVKKDIAFYHVPSKSLLEADLLFNLPAKEQFSAVGGSGAVPLLGSLFKPGGFMNGKIVGGFITDKASFKKSHDAVSALDLERIIPCHGDVVERAQDPKGMWKKVYAGLF